MTGRNTNYIDQLAKIVIKDKSTIIRDVLIRKLEGNAKRISLNDARIGFGALKNTGYPKDNIK